MHWFDQITAAVVAGGAVLLVGGLLYLRATGMTDGTRLFAAQTIQRALTDQLQTDLDNLGMLRPAGTDVVLEASTTRLAFHAVVDTSGTPGLVAYELQTGSGGALAIERTVDGASAIRWTDIRRFQARMLDLDGAVTTDPGAVRAVEVHVERNVGMDPGDASVARDPTVGWTTTVRPIALQYAY